MIAPNDPSGRELPESVFFIIFYIFLQVLRCFVMFFVGFRWFWKGLGGVGRGGEGWGGVGMGVCDCYCRAGIRLSTWMVQKVDTLKWKLTGLVNPDAEFDIANRSGRSRAVRWCLDIS